MNPINLARRILSPLSPQERRELFKLTPAVVLSSVLEVVGIASIAPFLSLAGNPELLNQDNLLSRLFTFLGFESQTSFLMLLGVGSLVVLVLSNSYTAFINWRLVRFGQLRAYTLTRRLLTRYIAQPYLFFVVHNSSHLTSNTLQETQRYTNSVLIPSIQVVVKAITAIFILALLIAVDPLLALSAIAFLGVSYVAIYYLVRHKLTEINRETIRANQQVFRTVREIFGAIKDLKLSGRYVNLVEQFSEPSRRLATYRTTGRVIKETPRYALEVVIFGGILTIVLVFLASGNELQQILPVLGIYAFAAYRLMPTLQAIFGGVSSIRTGISALDTFAQIPQTAFAYDDLKDENDVPALPFQRSIEFHDVAFRYPEAKEPLFTDLDLRIEANTSVAFVGTTGSGKTTAVDLLLGLLEPTSGTITVDGTEITEETRASWQRNLGYVPQHIYLSDNSLAHNIAFGVARDDIDLEAVERAARIAEIHDFIVSDLPNGYDTRVGDQGIKLSGGQRQRIGIARALYHDPAVLILDEATNALDSVTEEGVLRAINNIANTKTLIMIAHRLGTIRQCDTIFVIDRGQVIAQGDYAYLVATSKEFRKMVQEEYGEEAERPSIEARA